MEETIFSMGGVSLADSSSSLGDDLPPDTARQKIKVFYYVDDKPTPYVVEIEDAPNVITLQDFKEVFSFANKGFKYFCKALDKDLGCDVKLELVDDHCRLKKSANGLYELFLLSIQGGLSTLPRHSGTLPRKATKNDVYVGLEYPSSSRVRRRRSFEGLDAHFTPSITASSRGTVISRRAGEHLAELYTSNSEDPYCYDDSQSRVSLTESSMYDTVAVRPGDKCRRRKPRRERYRKAYVPSTASSVTASSATSRTLPRIIEVHLALNAAKYLGISVVPIDGSIIVSDIMRDGAVALDGRIEVGDQIVMVNHNSFETLSDQEAIQVLREVAAAKKPMVLYIAKRQLSDSHTETLTSLGADQTMPLDISLWVHTAMQNNERRLHSGVPDETQSEIERTFAEGTLDAETDDEEERRLYDERRHGIRLPRSAVEDAERRRENERNQQLAPPLSDCPMRYSVRMDPSIIVRAVARPNSGLVVKNRKWLKIPVPQSFIGSDLVDWLLENVEDIPDRKAARKYAASLLEQRYIKHVVSKLTFTEKCYYVFEEAVVGKVGSDCANTSSGTRGEATTEVTFIGSPAIRGRMHTQVGPQTMRNVLVADMTQETWPISPITVFNNARMNGRLRDCESPVTNDYASMVGESVVGGPLRGVCGPSSVGVPIRQAPPPNTPLCGSSLMAPPHPSPAETEFEDDDKRRMLNS